ncbi:MAG: (2Fe-2S)-binding protein [Bacteriovoracaceae bacterium]|nr:(2Fe-2S)-binding protein [Bacteriovoracaceae bacterium]
MDNEISEMNLDKNHNEKISFTKRAGERLEELIYFNEKDPGVSAGHLFPPGEFFYHTKEFWFKGIVKTASSIEAVSFGGNLSDISKLIMDVGIELSLKYMTSGMELPKFRDVDSFLRDNNQSEGLGLNQELAKTYFERVELFQKVITHSEYWKKSFQKDRGLELACRCFKVSHWYLEHLAMKGVDLSIENIKGLTQAGSKCGSCCRPQANQSLSDLELALGQVDGGVDFIMNNPDWRVLHSWGLSLSEFKFEPTFDLGRFFRPQIDGAFSALSYVNKLKLLKELVEGVLSPSIKAFGLSVLLHDLDDELIILELEGTNSSSHHIIEKARFILLEHLHKNLADERYNIIWAP